ncbi:MAG: hypothetical protein WCK59_02160 [Candidatus Falkowbacteria bacterium]
MITIILTLESRFYVGLAIVLILGSVFTLFALHSYRKKEAKEPEAKKKPEPEEEFRIRGLEEYFRNGSDPSIFINWQNEKIKIRTVKVFGKTEDKDKLIFASSLPFNFNGEDRRALREAIPELVEVSVLNSHQLLLLKSPATSFYQIDDLILKHLFIYLNRKYSWMNEKIVISFQYIEDDQLNCHMKKMTSDHVRLGILLGDIPGVVDRFDTVTQMEAKDAYQFNIKKESSVKWTDLLPKIQKVFRQYFTGGVEFIGPN